MLYLVKLKYTVFERKKSLPTNSLPSEDGKILDICILSVIFEYEFYYISMFFLLYADPICKTKNWTLNLEMKLSRFVSTIILKIKTILNTFSGGAI